LNERDQYIQSQVGPMLAPGERVLHTAFMVRQPGLIWQILLVGGLLLFLMTKAYYVVLTDRRMILVRTKMGFFKPAMANLGVEQWDVAQMSQCTTSGFANNRSMTFHFRDGSKQTLRISPWNGTVTGTKAFLDEVPKLVGSPQLSGGGAPALPAQQGYGQAPQQGYGQAPQQGYGQAPQQGFAPTPPPAAYAQQPAPAALAPGARVLVLWQDGNRYPATVAQVAQGQVLCTMPNGAQQWVPAQNVAPA
jgi:hypothetical protein